MTSWHTSDATARNERYLLGPLLKATSRSFYLSLCILPPRMRRSASLAYLLARAADTLADSWGGEASRRRVLVEEFRDALDSTATGISPAYALPPLPECLSPSERTLLRHICPAFSVLAATPPRARRLITRVVMTLTEGMLFDFINFDDEGRGSPSALRTFSELDRYTYLIAGVVGEFWTDLAVCSGVWPPRMRRILAPLGVRFGKGLQLVNILRDIPSDFTRRKRVYLPRDELDAASVPVRRLNDPGNYPRLKRLVCVIQKKWNHS